MMKAAILAIAIVAVGFLIGGRYSIVALQEQPTGSYVMIMDRFTGSVRYCTPAKCYPINYDAKISN